MSGWAIASVVGAVLAAVIIMLLVVVSRAVVRTAQNASALMEALEEVRKNTVVLADFETKSQNSSRVMDDAVAALRELRESERQGDGHEPNGS